MLLLSAGPELSATTLSGKQVTGTLLRASAEEIALQTASGEQMLATAELLALKPSSNATSIALAVPSVWIELIDGSRLLASEVTITKGIARTKLIGGESLDLSTRSLANVRLREQGSELAKQSQLARQWQDILAAQPTADALVIRKVTASEGDDAPRTAVLDQLEGVIGDVTEEKVHFTYDDQAIPVDRAKVEGLVYFHPAGRELPDPLCRLDTLEGSRWNLKSLTLAGETLRFVSTSGVKGEVPLARVAGLDYSAGKVQYLSDLAPEGVEWSNAYGTSGASASLAKLFAPRNDRSFSGGPIVVDGKSYEKGLALHSRTVIEYRLQGKYNKFLALASIDDQVRPAGDVLLVVSLDGKRLGEHRIHGKDTSATPLEYDVRGGRKLSLVVEFAGGLDVADRLHLANARVTK